MRERTLQLDDYGISRELYYELKWFCRQYPDKIAELSAIRGGFNNSQCSDMPRGGGPGDPTARRAMRAAQLDQEIRDIEQSAIEAAPEIYQYLLDSVGRGARFDKLDVPCGRNQFFEARRRFFFALSLRRSKVGYTGDVHM